MQARKILRDSVRFAFTQYVVRAALMLRGLIAARVLGPGPLGAWNTIQLVMDYGLFAPMGTQQGLDLVVPSRIVERDAASLDRVKRAGLFNVVMLTLGFAVLALLWASKGSSRVLDVWGYQGLIVALGIILVTNVAYYQLTLLRSHENVGAVSRWYFIQGTIGAGLGLAAIPWFGAWGLLGAWGIGTIAATGYTTVVSRAIAPLAPRAAPESRLLVHVGLPMFTYTASSLISRTLDRLIILRYLGTESLGLYSLPVMGLTFLLYLPDSIAYVIYPRLVSRLSEGGQDPAAIRDQAERVILAVGLFVPVLCGAVFVTSRELIVMFLPKFTPAVFAIRMLAFGAVGLALGNLASVVLMTLGRRSLLVPAALFATAFGAALDLLAIRLGLGVSGVALATLAAYALNGSLLLALAIAALGRRGTASLIFVGRAWLPGAIAFGLAGALTLWLPWKDTADPALRAVRVLLGLVMFAGGYALLVRPLTRGVGLRLLLDELPLPLTRGLGAIFRRGNPES